MTGTRLTLRCLALAATGLCLWCAPAPALADDVVPMPVAMILLDSSGSMEYTVDPNDSSSAYPKCHDSKQSGFVYKKSRWAVATEVLTGSYNEYWCQYDMRTTPSTREDYGYSIPHCKMRGTAIGGSEQQPDGLLDLYRDTVKFGFMAFDNNSSTSTTASGAYSYGPNKKSGYSNYNYGARNETAPWGKLVAPVLQDDVAQIRTVNDLIQQQIGISTPYNGTPISPLLDDAYYFFMNDPRIKPYDYTSGVGDPYWDCRKKVVILVTDGLPTNGEGSEGYLTSAGVAANLLSKGILVYVVGFQMESGANTIMDKIAKAGGTQTAYRANNQAELTAALGDIMLKIRANEPAEVRTTVTNRTETFVDKQYQFNASYSGAPWSPLDLVGHLDQFIFRCDRECRPENWDGSASVCEVVSLSDNLNGRLDDRDIRTQNGGFFVDFDADNLTLSASVLGIPASGELPRLDPFTLPTGQKVYSGLVLGDASTPAVRMEYRNQLIRLVRGDTGSRREGIRMGAILHFEPTLQQNLKSLQVAVPSFEVYRRKTAVMNRPTVLFAGTHDAQLHAFRVDRTKGLPEAEWGKELWSFIPKHLLGQLNQLGKGAPFLMDGSPAITEVLLSREDAFPDAVEEAELWRSVLVTGYGGGGRGYVALDVTDPVDPKLLWEVSSSEKCIGAGSWSSPGCWLSADYENLGYTTGTAALGSVFVLRDGKYLQRGVAILGGGAAVAGQAQSGKSVYVVDVATGDLLAEFCNDCGNVVWDQKQTPTGGGTVAAGLDCAISGNIAAYDSFVGGLITRAYVGDACGQVWRINLSSPNPQDWRMQFFYDSWQPTISGVSKANHPKRPVIWAPALATSQVAGQLTILVSTGEPGGGTRLPNSRDRVFSLREFWTGSRYEARVNWQLQLSANEMTTSAPMVFDETNYFTTVVGSGSFCDTGFGRIWGVDYDGLGGADTTVTDVIPKMDVDGNPLTNDIMPYIEYANSKAIGLQLVQRPTCFETPADYEPTTFMDGKAGATPPPAGTWEEDSQTGSSPSKTTQGYSFTDSKAGTLELVVQTGDVGTTTPNMAVPEGAGASTTGNKAAQKLSTPGQTVFSMSWGLLFE